MAKPRNNEAATPKKKMPEGVRFQKGNPGRPKGSRNKLGEAFLKAMHEDFDQHGVQAIEKVREEKPDQYLKVIASILPKELNVNVNETEGMTDAELLDRIRNLDATIRPFLDAQGEGGIDSGTTSQTTH